MTTAPNGHLLVTNGLNGQAVEIDPDTGTQIYARWIDANKAQSPPGSGDLFGIAMTPAGDGFYYVEDEVNMLVSGPLTACPSRRVAPFWRRPAGWSPPLALPRIGRAASAQGADPFRGEHQGGIATPQQSNTISPRSTSSRSSAATSSRLLRAWTDAAARLAQRQAATPIGADRACRPATAGTLGLARRV